MVNRVSPTRRCGALIVALALAGCDSPSLAFSGAPAQSITIGPSTFSVRIKGDRAEAIRTSRELRPSAAAILARARQAIEQASGCAVADDGMGGDQAIQRAKLDCN